MFTFSIDFFFADLVNAFQLKRGKTFQKGESGKRGKKEKRGKSTYINTTIK